MLNPHNIQNVILLWALSFKFVSFIIWFVYLENGPKDYYSDAENIKRISNRKVYFKCGSITGIVGLVLLSIYILMNM